MLIIPGICYGNLYLTGRGGNLRGSQKSKVNREL